MNEKTELSDERIKELAEQQGCWGASYGYSKESDFEKPVVPKHAYTFARAIEVELCAASPSSKSTKEAEPNALAIGEALHAAAAAIYFNDSSDYERALWAVVRKLAPGIADMLEKDASTFAQIRAALASPSIKEDGERAEPEPSAQGPAELWLQLHGDCSEAELGEPVDYTHGDVTWCWHQIHDTDVRYVRADLSWRKLAESLLALKEMDERIKAISERYGLGSASSGDTPEGGA